MAGTLFKYFYVTIQNAVDTETVGEGFIDNRKVPYFSSLPTTDALSTDKVRANIRWEEITEILTEHGAVDLLDIEVTGGDQNTAPTQIEFAVAVKSDVPMFMYDLLTDPSGKTIYGEASSDLSGDKTINVATPEEVIERLIAQALSANTFGIVREVIKVENGTGSLFSKVEVNPFGAGADHITRRAAIEANAALNVAVIVENDK